MIYSELKSDVAGYLQRTDLTDQIPGFIERTRLRIGRKLRGRENLTEGDITVTSGNGTVPTDYLEAVSLRNSDGVYLRPAGSRNFWAIRQATGTAYCYRIDDQVRVAPAATGTFTLGYFQQFAAFSSDSDTVSEEDMFLFGAVMEGFLYVGDSRSATDYKVLFDEAINHANRAYRLEVRPVSTYQRYDSGSIAL